MSDGRDWRGIETLSSFEFATVWRGRVVACTLVMIEGLENQHTMLVFDVDQTSLSVRS